MALYYYHKVMVVAYMYVVVAESALISERKKYYESLATAAQAAKASANAAAASADAAAKANAGIKDEQIARMIAAVQTAAANNCSLTPGATPNEFDHSLNALVNRIKGLLDENTALKELLNTAIPALAIVSLNS